MPNLPAVPVEAVPLPTTLVLPQSGEIVPLDQPEAVAYALAEVRDFKTRIDAARRTLEDALVEHSRRVGTKTLHLGALTAKVSGGSEIVWDLEELEKLRDAGLPEERWNALVTAEVSYKVNANVAKQIAGANEEYAKIVARARQEVPKSWRVSV